MIVIISIALMNYPVTPSRLIASAGLTAAAVTAAVATALAVSPGVPSARSAPQAAQSAGSLSFQPVLGLPASDVAVIGASPQEAPGEVWARGRIGEVPATVAGQSVADTETLLRYTSSSGAWQVVPIDDAHGNPLSFTWWASEVTTGGGIVLAGAQGSRPEGSSKAVQSIVTRNPGGAFAQAAAPSAQASEPGESPVLEPEEQLYPTGATPGRRSTAPLIAALDEPDGNTGAFVVPVWADTSSSASTSAATGTGLGTGTSTGTDTSAATGTSTSAGADTSTSAGTSTDASTSTEADTSAGTDTETGELTTPLGPGILRYDGSAWTREPICTQYAAGACTPASATLQPLAIAASSSQDAWLLADGSSGQLELFQRVTPDSGSKSSPVWVQVQFSSGLLAAGGAPTGETVSAPANGAILTATSQGVWIDLALTDGGQTASATLLASASSPGSGSGSGSGSGQSQGAVLGAWCYPTSLCPAGTPSLGAELPADYASFAWPGSSGEPGTRIITGLPDGALLRLQPGQSAFAYEIGGGAGGAGGAVGPGGETLGQIPGVAGAPGGGAAFVSPQEGWLGDDVASAQVTPQVLHATTTPAADRLQSWPVPFRRPLLALAAQPGTTPGAAGAQALAVGAGGQVARFQPGQGWVGEYLYNANGERQTPNLRGVAWPEPGRAYAVGDNGAMWLWQAQTGLWEPDQGKPLGFDGQLTAIAFSPTNPELGYAVGKQGTLLAYGKSWTQQALPPGLSQASFTSVAFAGEEALATYRMLRPGGVGETGGLIVNTGSGWQVDPSVQALLTQLPEQDRILSKVAGLPDGGAVAAGPGIVIERDPSPSPSSPSPWHLSSEPLPEAQNVSALAAIEEGSSVRALVSLDTGDDPNSSPLYEEIDNPPGPALGQYGTQLGPDPLPERGYLLRQTAGGWQDQEDLDYPDPGKLDLPGWPDAVLALLVDPGGDQGWAVGGQTGSELTLYGSPGAQEAVQTAGVMRYGAGPAAPQSTSASIPTPAGEATFAVGGNAQCASTCADFANENLGSYAWLSGAISRAGQIAGLHAFLYTGGRLSAEADKLPTDAFARELSDYAGLLDSDSSLPVYAAISPSDVPSGGTTAPFTQALGGDAPAGSAPAGTPAPPAGSAAYAFESAGAGGAARVIVLDYSQSELSSHDTAQASCPSEWNEPADQLQWLCAQLHDAAQSGVPAIVVGNADITDPSASNYAHDAQAVAAVLLGQGASAYLFDSPEENVSETIGSGANAVPAYGSGTLGYVSPPLSDPRDFLGASGFLTVSVNVGQRNATTNRAPVSASLIPSIAQLGVDATNGTLLRRSQVALFEGLARRPIGGGERLKSAGGDTLAEAPEPYTPIPESCEGANCSLFIPPAYSFTSSNPEVGQFVEQNPSSLNPLAVRQVGGKPVPDSASGLFCAYNAGTTTITLTTGGLSYSQQVTVQAGSIEQPCGTVPVTGSPAAEESKSLPSVPPLQPEAEEPTPATNPSLSLTVPPSPPRPPAAGATPAPHHSAPAALPLLAAAALPAQLRVALPPPSPQTARPSPPSGTSEVSEPVGVAEKEHEKESAVDVVHNAAAYVPGGNTLPPGSPLVLIVIAAAAGASIGRRRASRRPKLARASARVTSR